MNFYKKNGPRGEGSGLHKQHVQRKQSRGYVKKFNVQKPEPALSPFSSHPHTHFKEKKKKKKNLHKVFRFDQVCVEVGGE